MNTLVCRSCDHSEAVPSHCNKLMHIENIQGQMKLVCWMGPECGEMDIPEHCGKPMDIIS